MSKKKDRGSGKGLRRGKKAKKETKPSHSFSVKGATEEKTMRGLEGTESLGGRGEKKKKHRKLF